MTITYDPFHPKYFDEADLRGEMNRVFDLCHGCRLCFKYCSAFPTLFEFIDRFDDQDAARMTPAEQDQVVSECNNCKLCYINCPYIPGQSEWELDFPRLMLRAEQVQHAKGEKSLKQKVTDQALGRVDVTGKLGSLAAPVANKLLATPGSGARKLVEKVVGISADRILPPQARQRFSTWFNKRNRPTPAQPKGNAILFPTCQVEYANTGIGKDLVKVCERNEIACSLPPGQQCCGAPFLHQGNVEQFRKQGEANVKILTRAIRDAKARGEDPTIIVPQPTCGYVLKFDYPDYLPTEDAKLVASHTMDAAEYLMKVHKEGGGLDTGFSGDVPEQVTYHAPCHLRAQNIGLKSRDLLKLTGTKATVIAECSGIDGTWGLRAENLEAARAMGRKLFNGIEKAGHDTVVGDCSLANGGIELETGKAPVHPVQFLARAYGIEDEG
ncbi:MAG: heterodisulfide reductase-related iron-sulfur binding cluster [Acidimicrobiales bacterium]